MVICSRNHCFLYGIKIFWIFDPTFSCKKSTFVLYLYYRIVKNKPCDAKRLTLQGYCCMHNLYYQKVRYRKVIKYPILICDFFLIKMNTFFIKYTKNIISSVTNRLHLRKITLFLFLFFFLQWGPLVAMIKLGEGLRKPVSFLDTL